ncbi:MAG: hypothetical protein QOE49_5131, partial [Rhodospirillaceae bacterium]|nr:hypothetical protein [Rhodospirillaceae bacterium]
GQMMGDEFRLGSRDRRELCAQDIGDLPMQDLPPAPEQGFVGGVLNQWKTAWKSDPAWGVISAE